MGTAEAIALVVAGQSRPDGSGPGATGVDSCLPLLLLSNGVTVTKCHRPDSLFTIEMYSLQFWRLEGGLGRPYFLIDKHLT